MSRILSCLPLSAIGLFLSVSALYAQSTASVATPLSDGNCDEYGELADDRYELASDVTLYILQDADYVWMCYSLPPESYGVVDLYLAAPGLAEPINIHVSAQLGWRPSSDNSDRVWPIEGWWANVVRYNSYEGEGAERRVRFHPSPGREFQFAKWHFGRGDWRFQMEIHGIEVGGDPDGRIYFPENIGEGRELFTLRVW